MQVKLGGSGLYGPRNDQRLRRAKQRMWGVDARLHVAGVSLSGEYMDVKEELGATGKVTGLGSYTLPSPFEARGLWAMAAYTWRAELGPLRAATLYARYEQRHAEFEGFRPLKVSRQTAGFRVDLWESVILKAEVLFNNELYGAPQVDNDVVTSSAVYSW
jgi:hypothetical protein